MKKFLSAAEQAAESEDLMEFFNSAVDTLQTIVVGLGGALCVWGGINLLEGYGQDNPGSKSQANAATGKDKGIGGISRAKI
ncbi:Maff2 family mobile element protein [Gemmiger formicilis]|uniref:Maff2 family mobile element protein n=1 Tax=Gemmiger formicilis TaxID=745368 RepID=UPI003CF6C6A8